MLDQPERTRVDVVLSALRSPLRLVGLVVPSLGPFPLEIRAIQVATSSILSLPLLRHGRPHSEPVEHLVSLVVAPVVDSLVDVVVVEDVVERVFVAPVERVFVATISSYQRDYRIGPFCHRIDGLVHQIRNTSVF